MSFHKESSITFDLKVMAKIQVLFTHANADTMAMTLARWTYLSQLAKKERDNPPLLEAYHLHCSHFLQTFEDNLIPTFVV